MANIPGLPSFQPPRRKTRRTAGLDPQQLVLHDQFAEPAVDLVQLGLHGVALALLHGLLQAVDPTVPPSFQAADLDLHVPGHLVQGLAPEKPKHDLNLSAPAPVLGFTGHCHLQA